MLNKRLMMNNTKRSEGLLGYYMYHTALKPLHTIGKVSVNASILYKIQEICNKTNL